MNLKSLVVAVAFLLDLLFSIFKLNVDKANSVELANLAVALGGTIWGIYTNHKKEAAPAPVQSVVGGSELTPPPAP